MYVFAREPRSTITFRTRSDMGMWRVTRDDQVLSAYWSEGDARRGACLKARRLEAAGDAVRVLTPWGAAALRHNEPQFGR